MTDTDKIGTLHELDVKPGDVVELVSAMPGFENYVSKHKGREFVGVKGGAESRCGEYHFSGQSGHVFRLISRATPPLDLTEITTPFGLLPPETQKALRDHGGPYEMYQRGGWGEIAPVWVPQLTYRVKPYTAPREWWIVGDCEAYASEAEALEACKALYGNPAPVHVREVKE